MGVGHDLQLAVYDRMQRLRADASNAHEVRAVIHNTTYHNSGQVAAMGPNAMASNNILLQHIQQPWSSDELAQVATELSQLKRALAHQLATSGNDADVDDADADDAIEIGHVGSAEKAARKGDQVGVVDALKLLGQKTWGLAEQLGLAYLKMRAGEYLGLVDTT